MYVLHVLIMHAMSSAGKALDAMCLELCFLLSPGKCHSLLTGFTCLRKCHFCNSSETAMHWYALSSFPCMLLSCMFMHKYMHTQDWFNMKITAQWRQERPGNENPVRAPAPLLHELPGGGPCESPPDQMHTWHHGTGREFVASCIVSLINFITCPSLHACMMNNFSSCANVHVSMSVVAWGSLSMFLQNMGWTQHWAATSPWICIIPYVEDSQQTELFTG